MNDWNNERWEVAFSTDGPSPVKRFLEKKGENYIMKTEQEVIPEFPVVCICGSMRFYKSMLRIAEEFTFQSYIVLMPFATKDRIQSRHQDVKRIAEERLDLLHKAKIKMSHFIFVVDVDLPIPGVVYHGLPYIGKSTSDEINYAHALEKPVRFLSHEQWIFSSW